LVACLLAAPALALDCDHTADRNASIEGPGINEVVVIARAGRLVIRGEEGRGSVSAQGRACASSERLLEEIQLESRREGDTVYLEAVLPELDDDRLFGVSQEARLDLTIRVPSSVRIEARDSSGEMELSDVSSSKVEDSSGDLIVRNIAGDLEVTDSSGDVKITGIAGRLELRDKSGDVDVKDVSGDVLVTEDSSGDLNIEGIAGRVRLKEDASGDIEIADVASDVTIDNDGSGSIRAVRVGGNFTVDRDESGSIRYNEVMGAVRLPQD
ncbi:MAG TPA: DUF4097 family beta strand repeat-containing protein, partial [Steroidobacteraceae bacterium]